MGTNQQADAAWDDAWAWVRREHEQGPFDAGTRDELKAWLDGGPTRQAVYAKACRLWLLVGLVPPANRLDDPA